jgi:predicted anti-sigma-YlaC factor YlaD
VIARAHHLQDERLFDWYLAERGRGALDPPLAEHLADCRECAARYAELVSFMDGIRAVADAETDEVFTPERLRAQRQHIARRVGLLGRAAQIIEFPGRFVSRHINTSAARSVTRWAYGAAAAGLVIGVGLGALYDFEWRSRRAFGAITHQLSTPGPIVTGPVAAAGSTPAREASDEAFLTDLEVALDRPRTQELQPFDALTPHVREYNLP